MRRRPAEVPCSHLRSRRLGFGCKHFDATWPASSPHVTSVGGTYLGSGAEHGWAGSGGGYSSVFARPTYQDAAARAYAQSGVALPAPKLFNASGRVVPDVAALATCFVVITGGYHGTLSGTSAATPTFAGLVTRLNDERIASGKPPLGLLNPALYAAAARAAQPGAIGTDITDGNNKASGCPAGFAAAKGFDPVTGLGTPLWPVLRKLLLE